MIPVNSLRFIDDFDDNFEVPLRPEGGEAEAPRPEDEGAEPKVFVRTLSTAPAWPWDQARSADLEARHGAPLPLRELRYRLRRLEPWRPGAAGRYAAFYVLAKDVQERLEASASVDGQEHSVTFLAGRRRLELDVGRLSLTLAAAAVAGLGALSVWLAMDRRSETAGGLQLAEQTLASRLKRLEAQEKVREGARLLEIEAEPDARLRSVVDDLVWLANAKVPDARLEAVHWEPGLLAFEAKGEDYPLRLDADRDLKRGKKPIRKGVWLWGVTQAPEVAAQR